MTDHKKTRTKPARLYVTHDDVLSDEQYQKMVEEVKAYKKARRSESFWLKLFCPEGACLSEEERIDFPKC